MYILSSHATSHAWDHGSGAGLKALISKGSLIIVHTLNSLYSTQTSRCSNNRFLILNKLVFFRTTVKFHTNYSFKIPIWLKKWRLSSDMNHANYKKWLQELIPNLESKSVIVVDKASYPKVQINRRPTSNDRKGEMLFWLVKHDIWYSFGTTKVELYDLIRMHKPLIRDFSK